MNEILNNATSRMDKSIASLGQAFNKIRTGRANPAILDDIKQRGEGLQVMPGAVVHKFSSIGDQCVINTNATVDHDCIIGNGVHVMGGASIAGQVEVGNFSTVGTNATVLPNIKIGKCSYICAGAVVTKNVNDYEVVVGIPAKKIKKHNIDIYINIIKYRMDNCYNYNLDEKNKFIFINNIFIK